MGRGGGHRGDQTISDANINTPLRTVRRGDPFETKHSHPPVHPTPAAGPIGLPRVLRAAVRGCACVARERGRSLGRDGCGHPAPCTNTAAGGVDNRVCIACNVHLVHRHEILRIPLPNVLVEFRIVLEHLIPASVVKAASRTHRGQIPVRDVLWCAACSAAPTHERAAWVRTRQVWRRKRCLFRCCWRQGRAVSHPWRGRRNSAGKLT